MPEETRTSALPSGLRVVTERVPSVRSIALGFWVRTGSRNETVEQAGLSHFLEHLLFKGTDRYSSLEIDELFDGMGAEVNAGTGKETTSVYSRFLDRHLEPAFDALADMVLRPAYPDIDSERQVVIEEIAMYEDEPQDKVHDILSEAIFGDHPLGRPIIGRAEVVGGVPVPEIAAYHGARYVPGNIVVAAAGNVDHDAIVELVEGAAGDVADRRRDRPRAGARATSRRGSASTRRRPSSTTSASAGPACRAATTAASRCACSTPILGGSTLLAPLPGGAREARPRLLRLLVLEPVHRHRPRRHLRRHAARQRRARPSR